MPSSAHLVKDLAHKLGVIDGDTELCWSRICDNGSVNLVLGLEEGVQALLLDSLR